MIVSGENHTVPVVLLHGSGTNSSAWMAQEGHILPRQTNAIAAFLKSVSSEILQSDDLQQC